MKKILMTLLAGMVLNTLPAYADVALEMVRIPSGSFTMGCQEGRDKDCDSDEKPAHTVDLSRFELGKYEITQGQWKAVMGSNPSDFKKCGDTCPVESVSWDDIQIFIQKINAQTRKNYRLPSEAEWEYACRAGQAHYYCGSDKVDSVAWVYGNNDQKTHPVGSKQANAFGLYDMSGNVAEWLEDGDHHDDGYNGAPSNGAAWGGAGIGKALRGGSLNYNPPALSRATNRNFAASWWKDSLCGFRLARTLP